MNRSFASLLAPSLALCLTVGFLVGCDRKSPLTDTKSGPPSGIAKSAVLSGAFPYKDAVMFGGTRPMPEVAPENKDLLQIADKGDADNGDMEAKAELNGIKTLADRESEDVDTAFGGWAPPDNWRPAAALMKLRQKLNSIAPSRDKKDDGMVGDRRHWVKGKASDHNPWVKDSDGLGVVTGYDITNSPDKGCSAQKLVESLINAKDKRIKYIIWNSQIYSSDKINGIEPWTPRPYTGLNHHDKHAHISVLPNSNLYDNSDEWNISVH